MIAQNVKNSIALDLAYLNREVPAAIEKLAQEALKEVEDARNRDVPKIVDLKIAGGNGVENNEAVLPGVVG